MPPRLRHIFFLFTAVIIAPAQSALAAPTTRAAPSQPPITADAVAISIYRATDYLTVTQRPDGTFRADGPKLAETALVAEALFAAGITPSEGTSGLLLRRCLDALLAAAHRDPDLGQTDGFGLPGQCAAVSALAEALTVEPDPTRHADIQKHLTAMARTILAARPTNAAPQDAGGWPSPQSAPASDLATTALCAAALHDADRAGVPINPEVLSDAADFILRCRLSNPPGFAAHPVTFASRGAPTTRPVNVAVSTMAQSAVVLSQQDTPLRPELSALLQVILAAPPPTDPRDIPQWQYQRTRAALLIDTDTFPPAYQQAARYLIATQHPDGSFATADDHQPATTTALGLLTLSSPAQLTLEMRR